MNLKQDYKKIGGKVGILSVLGAKMVNDLISNMSGNDIYVDLESLIFEYVTVSVTGYIFGMISIIAIIKLKGIKGE